MPKNINCITIIITLKGTEQIKKKLHQNGMKNTVPLKGILTVTREAQNLKILRIQSQVEFRNLWVGSFKFRLIKINFVLLVKARNIFGIRVASLRMFNSYNLRLCKFHSQGDIASLCWHTMQWDLFGNFFLSRPKTPYCNVDRLLGLDVYI